MRISAIAAMSRNRVIGKNNQIPWHLPADLRFFKETTLGHYVIMGRKNFLSMPGPLPGRTNVVMTRDPFFASSGCLVVHSLGEALALAYGDGETEAFIIGGGEIYTLSMDILDRIYLTIIDAEIKGDVYFPVFKEADWQITHETRHVADTKNLYSFTIRTYDRISQTRI